MSAAASSFLADKWGCDKSGGAVRQESSSAADPGATISHSDPPGGCTASPMVDTLSVDLSERLLWIYVKSGNASEAKAEAASLLKDYAMQVRLQALRPEDDGTRQDADLAKAVESYRTESKLLIFRLLEYYYSVICAALVLGGSLCGVSYVVGIKARASVNTAKTRVVTWFSGTEYTA